MFLRGIMAKETTPKIISKKHLARLEKERIQNRIIVITSIIVLALVLFVVGFGILNQTVFQSTKPVARIGSEKISVVDFEKSVRFQRQQLIDQYNNYVSLSQSFGDNSNLSSYFQSSLDQITTQLNDPEKLGSSVLDNMINDRIIRQEAKTRGLTVTSDEIEKALQENFLYFADGTPTPIVNPTDAPTPPPSAEQLAMIKTLVPTIAPSPTQEPTVAGQIPTATQTSEPTLIAAGPTATEQV
jgi:hypothetical protein